MGISLSLSLWVIVLIVQAASWRFLCMLFLFFWVGSAFVFRVTGVWEDGLLWHIIKPCVVSHNEATSGHYFVCKYYHKLKFGFSTWLFSACILLSKSQAEDPFSTNWVGTTWITLILGVYIADAHLGRYWTLLIASCIYLLLIYSSLS